MAHSQVFMKALRVRRLLSTLSRAKENTIRELAGLPPLMTFWEKCCTGISMAVRECLCRTFCPCCVDIPSFSDLCCPEYSFAFRLCSVGYYPNTLMKRFLGFVFGSILATAIFFFLCLQFEANTEFALVASVCLGSVLSLGMAFFQSVRCIVFLALPSTCSSKGRSFLLMYVMVLIMNHPVQNFSHNLNVLTDAATCGQSLALNETKKMIEAAASPLTAVIGGIKKMLVSIRRFADDLRDAFKTLLRAVTEILDILVKVFSWLASIVDVCNENMGKPYRKCKKVFEDGYEACSDAMGPFDFVCEVVSLVGKVCHIARIGELLCIIAGAVRDLVLEQVGPPIVSRIVDIRMMFDFNVSITYHYHYNMNQSQSYSEVRDAILSEIRAKLSVFDIIRTILDNVMPLTVTLVVVKALLYRRGFLNKDGYDNVYITRHLFLIDDRRAEMDKETVFPLKNMEKLKYIPTFSWRLTKKEATKLVKGVTFWSFAAFHGAYYMVSDYGLYWILDLVRTHMDVRTTSSIPPHLKLHVKGEGPMADMYKAMVGVLEPVSDSGLDVDTTACLPQPSEPAWGVYKVIIAILIICFFLAIFEAYALRMRHAVAACYYPDRERARAVWLYNHILKTRGGFLAFTRRQLHRKRKDGKGIAKLSILSTLMARFPLLRPLIKLFGHERKHCMACGTEGNAKDYDNFSNCDNCNTVYCNDCFNDLDNTCTFCMAPVDYGDVDDDSVETDSSEDEEDKLIKATRVKAKKTKIAAKKEARRPSLLLKSFQQRFGPPQTRQQNQSVDIETGVGSLADGRGSEGSSSSDDESDSSESSSSYDTGYQLVTWESESDSEEETEEKEVENQKRKSTGRPSIRKPERVSMAIFERQSRKE